MKRISIGLMVLALLGGACGDGSGADTTASGTGSVTTSPVTTMPDPLAGEVGPVTVSGDPLPEFAGGDDPAVGLPAPVVTGTDYDGTEVTIGAPGQPQAVFFVAHWCPHCQTEVPVVVSWLDETGGVPGVEVVLVTVGVDPGESNFPPSAWLAREGWDGPVLRDDRVNTAFRAFGGSKIPYFVVVTADGAVAQRFVGETSAEALAAAIEAVG